MKKDLETTKRRKDWVTGLGLAFFVLIVVAELTVAVGVPLLVRREGVMGEKIVKLTTIEFFDGLRRNIENINKKWPDENVRAEAKLIGDTLNLQAEYLRTYADSITTAQFNQIHERSKQFNVILQKLNTGAAVSSRRDLVTADFLQRMAAGAAQ